LQIHRGFSDLRHLPDVFIFVGLVNQLEMNQGALRVSQLEIEDGLDGFQSLQGAVLFAEGIPGRYDEQTDQEDTHDGDFC
jgi:hypothetical protein